MYYLFISVLLTIKSYSQLNHRAAIQDFESESIPPHFYSIRKVKINAKTPAFYRWYTFNFVESPVAYLRGDWTALPLRLKKKCNSSRSPKNTPPFSKRFLERYPNVLDLYNIVNNKI